jgi:hypothetical protein
MHSYILQVVIHVAPQVIHLGQYCARNYVRTSIHSNFTHFTKFMCVYICNMFSPWATLRLILFRRSHLTFVSEALFEMYL